MRVVPGLTLIEMARQAQPDFSSRIVAAKLDGEIHDLQNDITGVRDVEFIVLDSKTGWQVYQRSVLFLLITAVHELYPQAEVVTQFTANKGLFCEVRQLAEDLRTGTYVQQIEQKMRAIVAENRPIRKEFLRREEAVQLFRAVHQEEKAALIATLARPVVSLYRCGSFYDYLYGPMLAATGELGKFALDFEPPGILLRLPDEETAGKIRERVPQPKLSQILSEAKSWAKILHCNYVMDLNRANRDGQIGEVIRVSEALQEKRIAGIADYIAQHRGGARLVLIAGPSSSGKTSFAQRLRIQLRVNGLEPVSISIDDYFRAREETPRNEKGEYDFECLEAMDLKLLGEHLNTLLAGGEVEIPRYDFQSGMKRYEGNMLHLEEKDILIMEGIHALDPAMVPDVDSSRIYRVYASCLTSFNLDENNCMSTSDNRLLRRMVRDNRTRGISPEGTILRWDSVRNGEEKYIFPFQENADVLMNTALIYEFPLLKYYAEPLLRRIPPSSAAYTEAVRLLKFLEYILPLQPAEIAAIPPTSIMREFIGGQTL